MLPPCSVTCAPDSALRPCEWSPIVLNVVSKALMELPAPVTDSAWEFWPAPTLETLLSVNVAAPPALTRRPTLDLFVVLGSPAVMTARSAFRLLPAMEMSIAAPAPAW